MKESDVNPIPAKFPGVCARTGQRYDKGALIVRIAGNKWVMAQDRKGNIKVAPDCRLCRFDGIVETREETIDVNRLRAGHCPCVKQRLSYEVEKAHTGSDQPDYGPWQAHRWQPQGPDFVCNACGRSVHVFTDVELEAREEETQ